MQKPKRRAW